MRILASVRRDQLVTDVLTLWPQTAQVFVARRMACVGCPVASFEALAEVAQAYELEEAHLLRLLEQSIDAAATTEADPLAGSTFDAAD